MTNPMYLMNLSQVHVIAFYFAKMGFETSICYICHWIVVDHNLIFQLKHANKCILALTKLLSITKRVYIFLTLLLSSKCQKPEDEDTEILNHEEEFSLPQSFFAKEES